jgi:hypothetical protein
MHGIVSPRIYEGRVGFAVGTGRCGTQFLARVLQRERTVASSHERCPLNETFHRYCVWNQLPVDSAGFLAQKRREIDADLAKASFSFEASPHLSFSIAALQDAFAPKFVLLVRSPNQVVPSYEAKGVFSSQIVRADHQLAIGYQDSDHFHHFLGRIVPRGDEFAEWCRLSQVGKLAWWWRTVNLAVLEAFHRHVPQSHFRVQKLERFDYAEYRELGEFLGLQLSIREKDFSRLAKARPNRIKDQRPASEWSQQERKEFLVQVRPIAEELGFTEIDNFCSAV